MGMIYKRKYKRPDGTIAQGAVWWIKYYRNGIPMRESTESEKESVARTLLRQREGDIVRGLAITPRTNRVRFDELAADVVNDYTVSGKRSLDDVTRHFELHLQPYFGAWRAANISTVEVRQYIANRQAQKASNATINRELAALKRAFSLGIEAGKLPVKPKIPMLRENNVRTGFFEREQFDTMRQHLPAPIQPLVTFGYITGWRIKSEVLPMQWRQVDFEGGTVRLDAGTTKNGEGRVFLLTAELRRVLEEQRTYTDAGQRERGIICPWVFHRNGQRIRGFRNPWAKACAAAPDASLTISAARQFATWSAPASRNGLR
jgi:integrase